MARPKTADQTILDSETESKLKRIVALQELLNSDGGFRLRVAQLMICGSIGVLNLLLNYLHFSAEDNSELLANKHLQKFQIVEVSSGIVYIPSELITAWNFLFKILQKEMDLAVQVLKLLSSIGYTRNKRSSDINSMCNYVNYFLYLLSSDENLITSNLVPSYNTRFNKDGLFEETAAGKQSLTVLGKVFLNMLLAILDRYECMDCLQEKLNPQFLEVKIAQEA